MMSRASVSLDRQAVAPKDSIWLHSAAVGRLASTTMRVSGWAWCSWKTSAGARRVPKLSNTTAGAWRSMARSTSPTGMSVCHQLEVGVLGDQDLEADGYEVLELGRYDGGHGGQSTGARGEKG